MANGPKKFKSGLLNTGNLDNDGPLIVTAPATQLQIKSDQSNAHEVFNLAYFSEAEDANYPTVAVTTGNANGSGTYNTTSDIFMRTGDIRDTATVNGLDALDGNKIRITGDLFMRAGDVRTGTAIIAANTRTGSVGFRSGAVRNAGITADTGDAGLYSGNNSGTGDTGTTFLSTGSAADGNSGNIELTTGTASGTRGQIRLTSEGINLDGLSSDIVLSTLSQVINFDNSQGKNLLDPTDAQDAATKAYVDLSRSAGDINETSFAAANNITVAENVTGLAFANATVRSFKAIVSVEIDADVDLYEVFELVGIQKAADWQMSVTSVGDESNVDFTITSAGQVQYTSGNETGYVSSAIKFRAITTTV